jgi:superfamily I DNA/RNA helicase
MMAMPEKPIAILYEHPEWFKPLFAELDKRDIDYKKKSSRGPPF